MKKQLLSFGLLCFSFYALAKENNNKEPKHPVQPLVIGCAPGTASADLDISNVRARVLQSGDMWWDLVNAQYEVPKNSGKHSMYAGALWIGGIDAGGQIKIAAQTYRQTGTDYYPGPLDTVTVDIDPTTCLAYDRFWKVTKQEVQDFINTGTATPDINSWPGNGTGNQGHFLAPFYDFNGDGFYDPANGDYPGYNFSGNYPTLTFGTASVSICNDYLFGDQNIWWVFNDVGNPHTETGSVPIGLEIRAQAFAFATASEAINNSTFYKYQIINRSSTVLNQTYFGQWVDPDLGNAVDDFVGCDVMRGLGFCYNGDADDDGASGYGLNPPAVGADFLQGPAADVTDGIDNDRDGCVDCTFLIDSNNDTTIVADTDLPEQIMMSKFLYYNNVNGTANGNPIGFTHFYNYLRGIWGDNLIMTHSCDGRDQAAPVANFMFPGDLTGGSTDPDFTDDLNESTCANPPDDRRFLQSAGAFTLQPGAVNYITTAVVWARATSGGPLASVALLKLDDDTIQDLFNSCFRNISTGVAENKPSDFIPSVSPNPFSNQTIIDFNNSKNDEFIFTLYDIKGKTVRKIEDIKSNKIILKKGNLNSGIYFFKLENKKGKSYSGKLIVD